jgi:hypothetical protein
MIASPTRIARSGTLAGLVAFALFTTAAPVQAQSASDAGFMGFTLYPQTCSEAETRSQVVGGLAGAVVGGLLGSQIGGGSGKTLATIAGTAIGGVTGAGVGGYVHGRNPDCAPAATTGPVYGQGTSVATGPIYHRSEPPAEIYGGAPRDLLGWQDAAWIDPPDRVTRP